MTTSKHIIGQKNIDLLFSQGDFHASPSLLQENNWARKMTVISGQKCSVLLKKQSPIGFLLKMLLESSTWFSTKCLLTWKVKTTKQERLLFQLVPKTPRTDETGYGLLPTTNAWDGRRGPGKEYNPKSKSQKDRTLEILIQRGLLPTPRAGNPGSRRQGTGGRVLAEEVVKVINMPFLPTPTANTSKNLGGEYQLCKKGRTETLGRSFYDPDWTKDWTEVATLFCRVDDGISPELDIAGARDNRVARLKALGNAIVPQIAYEIIQRIVLVEGTYKE